MAIGTTVGTSSTWIAIAKAAARGCMGEVGNGSLGACTLVHTLALRSHSGCEDSLGFTGLLCLLLCSLGLSLTSSLGPVVRILSTLQGSSSLCSSLCGDLSLCSADAMLLSGAASNGLGLSGTAAYKLLVQ